MDPSVLLRGTTLVGITTSLILSGTHFSSSQLTLPLLYPLPTATSTALFKPYYYNGMRTIIPMVVASTLGLAGSAYLESDVQKKTQYGLAAGLVFGTLVFTRIFLMDVNARLCLLADDAKEREKAGNEVVSLLKQWEWMNMVRAVMAGLGGFLGLYTVTGGL